MKLDEIRRGFSKAAVSCDEGKLVLLYADKERHVTQEIYDDSKRVFDELLELSETMVVARNPGKSVLLSFEGGIFADLKGVSMPIEHEKEIKDLPEIFVDTDGEDLLSFFWKNIEESWKNIKKAELTEELVRRELSKLTGFLYPNAVDLEDLAIDFHSQDVLGTEFSGEFKEILAKAVGLSSGIILEINAKEGTISMLFVA